MLQEALGAHRRRRIARIASVLVALAVAVGVMLYLTRDDGDDDERSPSAAPTEARGYDSRPPLTVEAGVDYSAVMETSHGRIEMDLLEKNAPKSVANFVFLARDGFYDGLTFHRVEEDLVIQGGDPAGDGTGGPGYSIPDENPPSPDVYVYGAVGMANSGPDTAGSQFFVVVHDAEDRDDPKKLRPAGFPPNYAVFAEVAESSFPTLEKIRKVPTQGGADPSVASLPLTPVSIESVEIIEG
jgi:cyclophilin family peptidyl-prolyl cis-trans isomerase